MDAYCSKAENQNCSFLEAQPADTLAASPPLQGKFVVVYLHGLMNNASICASLAKKLQKFFGDRIINIQPKCRERFKSVYPSISAQAQKVVEEIKITLCNSYPQSSEEELKNLPINIFGYSQGGIVAVELANHRDTLNIKTIIAAHAPLSGTDIFDNTMSDVNVFNEKAKPGLLAIGHPDTSLFAAKVLGTLLNNVCCKPILSFCFRGVRDMRMHSTCIGNIKACIREGKHNIPILLIAGQITEFHRYFDFREEDKSKVDNFIEAYTLITTGQIDGEHDLLIPVKRQLCRTDSFKNLATSKDDPVYPSNVEKYIALEILHCYNLVSILSDFQVNHGKTIFGSDETIAVIADFITKKGLKQ